ncbi:myeloid lymphoid or mixed-lineage leukemia 5 (trithorax, ) [Mortierella sp. NVP41]|nr:myeloid lymphoid or mixed-lineage leukemia 5 (trithorax, ) [Mortierella sp. NVP41]
MSSKAARQTPAKSEAKRSKRLMASARKSRQQRENIENSLSASLSSVTLATLPVQKQSTQIRKRLLTECRSNAALTPGDLLSNKRQKLLDDLRPDSAVLSVPPLHRTLSDKSSYLNQTPLHELSPDAKSLPTSALWKRASQLRRAVSDSDADADDEDDPLQKVAFPTTKVQALSQTSAMSSKGDADVSSTLKISPPQHQASNGLKESSSSVNNQPFLSMDDELFGSDTTLTSPEDDSDDDIKRPSHPTIKTKRVPSTKREVPFSTRTRSKRASLAGISESAIPTDGASRLAQIQSAADQPAPELVVSPVEPSSPNSLMALILEGKMKSTAAEPEPGEDDSSDDAQLEMSAMVASLRLKKESLSPSKPLAPKNISAVKDNDTSVRPPHGDRDSAVLVSTAATKTEDHVFAMPTLPVLRGNRLSSTRSKTAKAMNFTDRPVTRQVASRHSTRTMPRPRLFQTCFDIMSQLDPDRHRANIQSISLVLKHSLEQGMRKLQETVAEIQGEAEKPSEPKVTSVDMRAWGAVIGNGKGLFKASPRKQQEMERIAERRNIVMETYRALDFPPPPPGWDKSSVVISDNLTPEKVSVKTRSSKADKRWPTDLDNTLGCDYCQKTYQDRAGLANHMERCTMAQLQTSIANDMDGDSTASETEEQRKARSPTALLEKKAGLKVMEEISECDDEADGDEEGIIMCVCGSKEDEGAMVQCDKCEVWLHLECLDLSEDDVPEEYFCPTCQGIPVPSTGGKSFRHVPAKTTKRSRGQTKASRTRHRSGGHGAASAKGSRRISRPKPVPHWMHVRLEAKAESESDTEDIYSTGTDEDESHHAQEGMVSPQVTLNHDWKLGGQGSGGILGYDSEYMSTLFGVSSAHAIFKKSRAPALMLDGSSSQEVQAGLSSSLLSNDLGFHDHEGVVFPGAANRQTILESRVGSEGGMSFRESDPFGSETLFEHGYIPADGSNSSQNLGSDDTIESEGLRTPTDLWRDTDQTDQWVLSNFGEVMSESTAEFGLENSTPVSAELKGTAIAPYPELLTNNVIDWYCDQDLLRAESFDIAGLIDLEAVSTPEEN